MTAGLAPIAYLLNGRDGENHDGISAGGLIPCVDAGSGFSDLQIL